MVRYGDNCDLYNDQFMYPVFLLLADLQPHGIQEIQSKLNDLYPLPKVGGKNSLELKSITNLKNKLFSYEKGGTTIQLKLRHVKWIDSFFMIDST